MQTETEIKKKSKKGLFNALFLFAVFGLTAYGVFHGRNLGILMKQMQHADTRYWLLSIPFVITFILSESVIIFYMIRNLGLKVKLTHCFLYSFVGFFFSCITPSATGGQPMQVYYMRKDNIPGATATVVLMIVTITYKMVLVILGLAVLILRPAAIMKYLEPAMFWMYLGIALNVFCVSFMLFLIFYPKAAEWILMKLMRLLCRIHILKHEEKHTASISRIMEQYAGVSEYFKTHKLVLVNVTLISIVQRFLLFFVTWLVYCSFHLHGERVETIVSLQGMISVAVDMLPLPGGMGISEGLFGKIFHPIFGHLTLAGMVVSRGLSYYSELLISAVMTVLTQFTLGRKK